MTTKLVLVDDSELIRRGLKLLLCTAPDLEVIGEAGDGVEALALLETVRPDVVLSDVKMPRKGGVELAREIGQRHPGLPVILLTTFDDDAVVRGAVDAGVAGFLLKDSSTDDLVAAIGSAQSGGLVLDPRIARAAVTPAPVVSDPLAALTPGEHAVAELVAEGATNQEIAQRLFIAEGTVKNHVSALLRKPDQRDRTGLALFLSRTRPPRR